MAASNMPDSSPSYVHSVPVARIDVSSFSNLVIAFPISHLRHSLTPVVLITSSFFINLMG